MKSMKELMNVSLIDPPGPPAVPTVRDWAAVGFRHTRLAVVTFLLVFGSVVFVTWLMPARYESELKILVKPERIDPIVSPESNAQSFAQNAVTEQDVNSEVEILKSHDLLEKVVTTSQLNAPHAPTGLKAILGYLWTVDPGPRVRTVIATQNLEKDLKVEPLKKTNMLRVAYRSTDPRQAERVLRNLSDLYLDKHLEVHRVPGALEFFQAQTKQYRSGLSDAEKQMATFASKGSVAPQLEKEIVLHKMNDFEGQLQQTQASIVATEKRIATLQQELSATPARLTTQMKVADNPLLLQQMKSTLLNLELKRTELVNKYDPNYPPVKEVDAQIAQAREALAKAESNPVKEETTDRDTTHEWLTSELAKARAELTSLQGTRSAMLLSIASYKREVQTLSNASIAQQAILRDAKTAEDNYLLYSRKEEETRISEALDQRRMINVSVAEAPTVPVLPASPNWGLNLLLGLLLATLASVGLSLAADYMDRSFRTPEEVELFLNVPVLGSLPVEAGGR
jgi:uncharacterized protein involved in exopolysaccharide biosynthesis